MTVNASTRRAGPFIGAGVIVAYPFTFKVFARTDLLVVRTDASSTVSTTLVLDSDYSVTLNVDQDATPGGSLSYLVGGVSTALPVGQALTVVGNLPYAQPTDLTNGGAFYPQVIEDALDRVTMLLQQIGEIADRALVVPVGDTGLTELPTVSDRANQMLAFDSTGNVVTVAPSSGSSAALALDLLSIISAAKAAGQVGFNPGLIYGANTVGAYLRRIASSSSAADGVALTGYDPGTPYASGLGQILNLMFGRTAAEIVVGWIPTNYYPASDVRRYGVIGNSDGTAGVGTDDSTALRRVAAIINAGQKFIDFGGLSMRCFSDASTATLLALTSVNGLLIRFSGARFVVDRTFTGSQVVDICIMTACKNITGDPPRIVCTHSQAAGQHTSRGPQFLELKQGCENIVFAGIEATDFRQVWHFSRLSSDPESYASRGLYFGVTKAYRCGYPLAGSLSGYGVTAELHTEECGRSYFCTGGIGHNIDVFSTNAQASIDALITTDQGFGMNGLNLNYHNTESTGADNSLNCVNVQFQEGDLYVGTHRNIKVRLNIKNPDAAKFLGFGFGWSKLKADDTADALDRGHVLENLDVSGTIQGASANQRTMAATQGTFGAGDNFRTWEFHDLNMDTVGQPNYSIGSLKDTAIFDGVTCSTTMNVTGGGVGTRTVFTNCSRPIAVLGGLVYPLDPANVTVTYSAAMTFDVADGDQFTISANTGAAFAINAPLNPAFGRTITIVIRNINGAGLGVATFNAVFKLAGAWVQPANTFNRSITFRHDGTSWQERGRSPADIPN